MKHRSIEIDERAQAILGVTSRYDIEAIKRNFRRQLRLLNPDGPDAPAQGVPGYDNSLLARLLIQAYGRLIGRPGPTTMLENDDLVGILLDGDITPMDQTTSAETWNARQFYDQFRHSIWPDNPTFDKDKTSKFGGIC